MGERRFIEYEPDQDFLLPPSLRDWLPENHPAHYISDVVDALDLSAWEADYRTDTGAGAPPFPPRMMLKVLIYGYANGVFSSRKLAKRCLEDVAFRYLSAQLEPDFRSIIKFRKRHIARFVGLFAEVVHLAQESGLVKLGRLAIDGSKIKANASKHKSMSYGRMCDKEQELKAEIQAIMKQAETVDTEEDAEHGEADGYSLPEQLSHRQQRLATIQAAKQRLEERARQRAAQEQQRREEEALERAAQGEKPKAYRKGPDAVPKAKEQENFTDPDSRIMRDGATKGFIQAYNAQIAVDAEHQIIVATDLDNQASDQGHFVPMLEQVKENTGSGPKQALADAGYKSEATFEALAEHPADVYIACGRETYDPRIPCPEGPAPKEATLTQRMEHKLLTNEGRSIYRQRKHIVEPVFGWIKNVLGFRQTSLRGQKNVRGEWFLVCSALNLRRMAAKA